MQIVAAGIAHEHLLALVEGSVCVELIHARGLVEARHARLPLGRAVTRRCRRNDARWFDGLMIEKVSKGNERPDRVEWHMTRATEHGAVRPQIQLEGELARRLGRASERQLECPTYALEARCHLCSIAASQRHERCRHAVFGNHTELVLVERRQQRVESRQHVNVLVPERRGTTQSFEHQMHVQELEITQCARTKPCQRRHDLLDLVACARRARTHEQLLGHRQDHLTMLDRSRCHEPESLTIGKDSHSYRRRVPRAFVIESMTCQPLDEAVETFIRLVCVRVHVVVSQSNIRLNT